MAERASASPWVWVGCGCAALLVLTLAALGGASWFLVSSVGKLEEELRDPATRTSRALEILEAETLPEGYHAEIFVEIPYLLRMVGLTDGPESPGEPENLEADRLFLLLRVRGQREDLHRFVTGETPHLDLDMEVDLDAEIGDELARGTLDLHDGRRALWIAHQAKYEGETRRIDGIQTVVLGECDRTTWIDFAFWLRPSVEDPTPERLGADLEELLAPLRLCPGARIPTG